MLVVGLTGGIGSGKSLAALFFAELGVEIIDTDELAREIVKPGSAALERIAEHYGCDFLNERNELDRRKLREVVFENASERQWLERLLHPLIREKAKQRIAASKAPYCIIVIPLLVESTPNPIINRILVIDAPEELQIERAMQRDNVSLEHVKAIMSVQASREKRLAAADDVITNDKDLNHLKQQVQQLHQTYLNSRND